MTAVPDNTAMIGLDWGTSSFRAYLLDDAGRILDRKASDAGALFFITKPFTVDGFQESLSPVFS